MATTYSRKYEEVFSRKYEEAFAWCAADPKNAKSGKCVWCNKSFKIDTMGKIALSSHEKSKKHQSFAAAKRTNLPVVKLTSSEEKQTRSK